MRHPLISITATTNPSTTDLTEWIVWADGKILAYLQTGNTLPTENGGIIENVADDLLIRKWRYEKRTSFPNPQGEAGSAMPELTAQNKAELDSLKGQNPSIEEPAFNFDLSRTVGGFD